MSTSATPSLQLQIRHLPPKPRKADPPPYIRFKYVSYLKPTDAFLLPEIVPLGRSGCPIPGPHLRVALESREAVGGRWETVQRIDLPPGDRDSARKAADFLRDGFLNHIRPYHGWKAACVGEPKTTPGNAITVYFSHNKLEGLGTAAPSFVIKYTYGFSEEPVTTRLLKQGLDSTGGSNARPLFDVSEPSEPVTVGYTLFYRTVSQRITIDPERAQEKNGLIRRMAQVLKERGWSMTTEPSGSNNENVYSFSSGLSLPNQIPTSIRAFFGWQLQENGHQTLAGHPARHPSPTGLQAIAGHKRPIFLQLCFGSAVVADKDLLNANTQVKDGQELWKVHARVVEQVGKMRRTYQKVEVKEVGNSHIKTVEDVFNALKPELRAKGWTVDGRLTELSTSPKDSATNAPATRPIAHFAVRLKHRDY